MSGGIEGVVEAAGEALAADAVVQTAADTQGRRQTGDTCANCGTKLLGPHCHACGQVADDLHRPFWSLIKEAIEGLFSLDGRFFKTIPALLFRPGVITKSYLDGARARYVQPFRLFLVSAVVFLLAVSSVTGDWTSIDFDTARGSPEDVAEARRNLDEQAEAARASGDEMRADILDQVNDELAANELPAPKEETGDTRTLAERRAAQIERRENMKCDVRRDILPEEIGTCPAEAEGREDTFQLGPAGNEDILAWPIGLRRLIVHQAEVVIDDPNRYLESVNSWISRVLIGLFPVYALLLAVMHFWKRRFFYYDHLIVSLHFHSFLFIMLTLLILTSSFVHIALLCLIFFLWSNLYVYRVHRRVYGCGRFSSAFRTLAIDFVYLVVLAFTPAVLAVVGFLTA
jgi:hypothetical protein